MLVWMGKHCISQSLGRAGWGVLACAAWVIGLKAAAPQLPDGPGKAATQKVCSGCHAAEIVLGRHETRERWEEIVSNMVDKGANGTDDEFNAIIDYLAANFAKEGGKTE